MEGTRRLAAILVADVAGYSRLMGDDEAATVRTLTEYRDLFKERAALHGGRIVDTAGDSVLVVFDSAVEAVEYALEIQKTLDRRNHQLAEHRRMRFRIGINLGDVIVREDGIIYGDGVNIAARLQSLAEPDGLWISGTVYDQIDGKLLVPFEFAGEQSVKNIMKPVRTYRALLDFSDKDDVTVGRSRARRIAVATATLIGCAVAIGAVGWYSNELRTATGLRKEDPVLAMPTGPGVAVLPFDNLSGDPKQDYFADGITEQIITELTRFRTLHVIARNSTFRYKGKAIDVRQVGRDLMAGYVLEGSVRREAQRIRVTAQLLDASSGTHLWAESYDRDLTVGGIFEVQDDITNRVVGSIGCAYGALSRATLEQSKAKPSTRFDAYECVLRTYEYWAISSEPEHFKVRECLERAVQADPNFADAWASLSRVYVEEHQQGYNQRPNALGRARDAARHAIDLDPHNQHAYEALAMVAFFQRDLDSFFSIAERAVSLNPNYENTLAEMGTLITYSNWTNSDRRERGLALVRTAMALNPSHPDWYRLPIAWVHWWKGEYSEALIEAKRINMPDYFWTHKPLAVIYARLGRKEEAAAAVTNVLRLRPDYPVTVRAEWRKWNVPEPVIDRAISDLRQAGMNIPQGT